MSIEVAIHEFVFINNALKEFGDMKYEIENSKDKWKFKLYTNQRYKVRRNTEVKNTKL